MALKGISDIQQRQIEELIAPFMTIETNLKKNGLNLSAETISTIKESKKVAEFATKENIQLPKSTYEILRYGPAVEEQIFKNLDKLSGYTKVKVRVRKGVQIQHILTWDARSIEAILKKSDKPKVKSQDDKKVFKEFLSNFTNFDNFDQDLNLFRTYQRLFLEKNSLFTTHFLKGNNYLEDYVEKKTKLAQREKEQSVEQVRFNELDKERISLEKEISDATDTFYNEHKTGRGIKMKKDQIERLEKAEPLASYVKLLGDLIETFDSYATKQDVNLTFDEQNVLRDLKESIITHERSVDLHFSSLLTVIIRHADVAFGKKHWYMKLLQELGSIDKLEDYIRSGPGYKAWLEAREFAKDVYELQHTDEFEQFQIEISSVEASKKKVVEDIGRVNERLRRFNQDVAELQENMDSLKTNLDQWTADAKQLV